MAIEPLFERYSFPGVPKLDTVLQDFRRKTNELINYFLGVDFGNLRLHDTDQSDLLDIKWNEAESNPYTLNLKVNSADRTVDLSGNLTVESTSVINSDLSTDANWATSGTLTAGSNFGVGITAWGTSAAKVLGIGGSTAPTTSPANMVQLWSADRSAGYAQLYYRAEGGEPHPLDTRYNVMDYGAKGDGTTDDTAAIHAAIDDLPTAAGGAMGGYIYFPPGHVWGIGSTVTIDAQGMRFGSDYGGMASQGSCTLKALSGFSGPMIEINIGAGEKGCRVQNIMLDGNNEGSITAGIEYANGTIASSNLYDVSIAGCVKGILTGDNIQSIIWERLIIYSGIDIGIEFGTNNRHIQCYASRIGGTVRALLIGPDDAVANNRCESIHFIGGEFYVLGSTPYDVILVRNARTVNFNNCWIEEGSSSTITSMIIIGTANAEANYVSLRDCNIYGNSRATNGVEIVDGNFVNVESTISTVTNTVTVTDSGATGCSYNIGGNIGIRGVPGVTGLDVYGDIFFGHSNTGKFTFKDAGGNEAAYLQLATTVLNIYADSDINFRPNNTLAATFTAAGLLNVVGGFSDNGSAGIDTTFLDDDGNTITVKGGIVTAKTAP